MKHDFLDDKAVIAVMQRQFPEFFGGDGVKAPLMVFRSRPTDDDPTFELQLLWDMGERLETYAWVWLDAYSGAVAKKFPE